MKNWMLIFVVVLSIFLVGMALAKPLAFTLPWWTVAGGGGESAGASYRVYGAIGQPGLGDMASSNYRLRGGFLNGAVLLQQRFYLPLALR